MLYQRTSATGYRRVARLAHGGMCESWLALPDTIGNPSMVALKQLLPELRSSRTANQALVAEAKLLATLDHPNIVRCYGLSEVDGIPSIVLELVHGDALHSIQAQCLSHGMRLPDVSILYLLERFASALTYVHAQKHHGKALTHDDISPQNMMIDYRGHARLIDFGVSNGVRGRGQLVAKPAYSSPEQMLGLEHGPKGDMFALGIVAWELLTGRRWITTTNPIIAARQIVRGEIPCLQRLRPDLDPGISYAVMPLLRRDPNARPCAEEFQQTLQQLLLQGPRTEKHAPQLGRFLRAYAPRRNEQLKQELVVLSHIGSTKQAPATSLPSIAAESPTGTA